MSDLELCIEFVKDFYSVTVRKSYGDNVIVLHDCLEKSQTKKLHFIGTVMGYDVFFIWDKAEDITGINIDLKVNSKILPTISGKLKNIQTFSFFKYLIDSTDRRDKSITINMSEVMEEFPSLYGDVIDNGVYNEFKLEDHP